MKQSRDMLLTANEAVTPECNLLTFNAADGGALPAVRPGQFAQVRVDNSPTTYLRRPISVCDADAMTLTMLVRRAGPGTEALVSLKPGAVVNMLLPLGNGFPAEGSRPLLVGGGVGVAPLLLLGKSLVSHGIMPHYIIGAKTATLLAIADKLAQYGPVELCTDDGSKGFHGLVTEHPIWNEPYDIVYCCGPLPMMKAVARRATASCYVSLENKMACGLGACLCCVEDTVEQGNVCVCTEGPVFNTNSLKWTV